MKEIPKIISTKDLSYFEDIMNWNLTLSKKCHMYKDLITDSEIKKFISEVAKMHSVHYEKILNILS